ncbi:MAG: hypothetical protein HYV09_19920 [Deltaproteobacteria bacterium]|nr:hypothetical protein [Deltaproteobacteria bacterium]
MTRNGLRAHGCGALAVIAVVAFAGQAFAQDGQGEDRKDETAPPTPPPPTPYTPPPPTYAPSPSIAEPPPSPKKKYDDQEYDEPWVTGTARLADRFYEGGPFTGAGGPLAINGLESPVALGGVRVLENHGYLSKLFIATLMAMGQGNSRYMGSTYHRDSAGNTWRTDYYRPLTPAEREANARAMNAAISAEYVMELTVYSPSLTLANRDERAVAKGFEFYIGGEFPLGKTSGKDLPSIMQIAFVGSHITADGIFKAGEGPYPQSTTSYRAPLYYSNLGVMVRTIFPITAWAEAYVHWDLNILTLFKQQPEKGYVWTSPFRAGLNFNITDRAYVRAHGSVNGFGAYALGWHSELGVRF